MWWKLFFFALDENVKNTKWHLVGHKRFKFQFEGYREPIFKAFILFAWIMIWFAWESTAYRSRLLVFDQKGLDYARNIGLGYWLWRENDIYKLKSV
jgi:hypothetical protein